MNLHYKLATYPPIDLANAPLFYPKRCPACGAISTVLPGAGIVYECGGAYVTGEYGKMMVGRCKAYDDIEVLLRMAVAFSMVDNHNAEYLRIINKIDCPAATSMLYEKWCHTHFIKSKGFFEAVYFEHCKNEVDCRWACGVQGNGKPMYTYDLRNRLAMVQAIGFNQRGLLSFNLK